MVTEIISYTVLCCLLDLLAAKVLALPTHMIGVWYINFEKYLGRKLLWVGSLQAVLL